jgi:GNAT superfamily N-acetyltransferase
MIDPFAMTPWVVTELREADWLVWQQLYRGYGDFYEVAMPVTKLERVWSWLHDSSHSVNGLAVRPSFEAEPVGIAHYRPFARPLHGSVGCYLDDLFVEPSVRGTGAVDALLLRLSQLAGENGWDVVRWITRSGNARARSTYDRLASQTDLITYDLPPD